MRPLSDRVAEELAMNGDQTIGQAIEAAYAKTSDDEKRAEAERMLPDTLIARREE